MLCGLEPFKRLFLIHSQLAEKTNKQKFTLSSIASNEAHQTSERNELRLQDVCNFSVSVRVCFCFCLLVGYLYNNEDSPSRLASFCVLGSEQFLQG